MPSFDGESAMIAATMVFDAALTLASGASDDVHRDQYLGVAVRLGDVLEGRPTREDVLAASPRVTERSGCVRTLVEMIEDQPGGPPERFRLTMLLMRALVWDPTDTVSALEVLRQSRELIRYQWLLIDRRLDELRKGHHRT